MAARHDGQCNGIVFVIGGSSGGSHALWTALDPVANGVPGWGQSEIPKAVVGLSGSFNLSLREGDNADDMADFVRVVKNYTNTQDNQAGRDYQLTVSPVYRVPLVSVSAIPPLRLYNTEFDPMPYQQMDAMAEALRNRGFTNYTATKIDGIAMHAFDYWHTPAYPNGPRVSAEVIAFFNANLP